ncbi:MAG: hypothetical protein LUH58_04915 [Lachnospiraceae bacterium]|nr:hypothetical protein [Lachnospiraceae bacterium]
MRVTDKLIEETKKKAEKPEPEDEEMDEYMEWKKQPSLNEYRGVFDSNTFGGINTQKSVFDQKAIFHTEGKEVR